MLLQAPPGAGKTTRVPIALLEPPPGSTCPNPIGRIWMLEPRRLAAKAAAQRLAAELGESVGERVGYSIRLESRTSAATRLEVLTDGLFLRRLQADPGLEGVDCLIFDEFHERGADTDLALALVRQARELLKPDLRLVVMSATLNLAPLAQQLPGATVLSGEGRCHPVTITYQTPRGDERLEQQVVRALEQHWLEQRGPGETVLVFLPGLREIQACSRAIAATTWGQAVDCVPLHGNMPLAAQGRAIGPAPQAAGKVVLATSIAESSLTLAGVSLVLDSGLSRRNRFNPGSGMDGLVTVPASLASAEQRAGRAGRLGPGRCLRLWSAADQQRRPAFDPPELLELDPMPLALQLARWGDPLGSSLCWLDPPPAQALQEARQRLLQLGAIEEQGRLSPHGHRLAELGLHPRLAQMLLLGKQLGQPKLACALAVLLSERDPLPRQEVGCDLLRRLDWLAGAGSPADGRRRQLRQLQAQLERQVRLLPQHPPLPGTAPRGEGVGSIADSAAQLVAAAYPERLALARPGRPGWFLLSGGRGAVLHPDDPLMASPALAIAQLDGQGQDARIQLALALDPEHLRELARQPGGPGRIQFHSHWDRGAQRVRSERCLCLGSLVLERQSWHDADPDGIGRALLDGLRQLGLEALGWDRSSRQLQHRLNLAHQHLGDPWPDRSDAWLLAELETWLKPWLLGLRSREDLRKIPLEDALWGNCPWSLRPQLERILPVGLTVPSGRRVELDYSSGLPVLAAKLQEFFGTSTNPTVLEGRLVVTVQLLTPAGRPAAITQDLAGFWQGGYQEVRRQLRGRYPKHPWPEDPCQAEATALTKSKSKSNPDTRASRLP